MTATYEAIATTTLGSAQSSVTFSSISGSFTDLVLIVSGKSNAENSNVLLEYNSATGSNYSVTILFGDGASAGSARVSNATSANLGRLGNENISNSIINIFNYSNTTTFKTAIGRGNVALGGNAEVNAKVALWRSTSAITSVLIKLSAGNFDTGSTFTLYGIKSEA